MGDSHNGVLIATAAAFITGHILALAADAPSRIVIYECFSLLAAAVHAALRHARCRARVRCALRGGRDLGQATAALPPVERNP